MFTLFNKEIVSKKLNLGITQICL